jgi:hypothetical protein
MQILITDGGPHPPEKWAHVSVSEIMQVIQVAPSAPQTAFRARRDLEGKLFDLLIKLHGQIQEFERASLAADASAIHADLSHLAEIGAKGAIDLILMQVKDTAFAEHFNRQDVKDHIARVLGQHFADSMHIERHWHADRNPENEHVKAYRKKYNMG